MLTYIIDFITYFVRELHDALSKKEENANFLTRTLMEATELCWTIIL